MVVHLTVRLPVVLEEAAIDEGREALLPAEEREAQEPSWAMLKGLPPPW